MKKCGIEIDFDEAIFEYLARKSYDKRLGVRALLRLIADEIEGEISAHLLDGKAMHIVISIDNDEIKFESLPCVDRLHR